MKSMIVGLLAVVGVSACGVGVDDPEGQAAVAQHQQAVYVDANGNVLAYAGQTTATPAAPGSGGATELPQDPVPVHPNVIIVTPTANVAH
jgi:hypothetical protein